MGREVESIWVAEVNEDWQIERSNPIYDKCPNSETGHENTEKILN